MQLSFVTRKEWTDLKNLELRPRAFDAPLPEGEVPPPGGGGIVSKYINVRKACPDAQFVTHVRDVTSLVAIVEPLTFWGLDGIGEECNYEAKRDALAEYQGVKLLWAEEQEVIRWWGGPRQAILDRVHAVLACNAYQEQLLKAVCDKPITRLYTPIDASLYAVREKKPCVVAVGKVGLQKNTDTLIELFRLLKGRVETVYIGNAGLWGTYTYAEDRELERELASVVDVHIPSATAVEVAKVVGESLCYINMSVYDVGCLSYLEAAMAGCWCFSWDYHLMFDEYQHCQKVHDVADAAEQIIDRVTFECVPCDALRNEVHLKHSYDAFRTQLQRAVQEVIFDANGFNG